MYNLLADTPDYTLYFFLAIGAVMLIAVFVGLFKIIHTPTGKQGGKSSWEREAESLAEKHTADELYAMARERAESDYLLSKKLVEKAAEKGNAQAQLEMGIQKQFDDNAVAAEWFKKAAEQGIEEAYERLGDLYHFGSDVGDSSVQTDPQEAVKWYTPIAEKGNVEAQKKLALCYSIDLKDEKNSLKWNLRAAETGDGEAIRAVILHYGAEGDYENEKLWTEKLAGNGDAEAQYDLGALYEYADEPDLAQAVSWYKKSANSGNERAKVKLALLSLKGEGVEKDEVRAIQTLKTLSDGGNEWAAYNLGKCYLEGTGVLKDENKAFECFEKSQVLTGSKYRLALMYLEGKSVAVDKNKAFELLLAANDDTYDDDVKYKLGECYFFGIGAEKDREKARKLWRQSAKWENKEAIAALELHFGETVEKDD